MDRPPLIIVEMYYVRLCGRLTEAAAKSHFRDAQQSPSRMLLTLKRRRGLVRGSSSPSYPVRPTIFAHCPVKNAPT